MKKLFAHLTKSKKEFAFQLILHILVFLFYALGGKPPKIELYELAFFADYALSAALVSFYLIPKFLYHQRYILFTIGFVLILISLLLTEELFLEQIFFPDTRGSNFPGLLFSIIKLMPTWVILIGGKLAWDALAKQRELEKLQMMIKESELQFLRSQINPHFLFNNLNNLYAYAIEESPKTPEIILNLSSVLRYMLYDCKDEYVALSKELEQLKNFVDLSELQIEERGIVTFHANANVFYKIAPLILVVFVENAFKHSTASQSDNIFIEIKASVNEEGYLAFSCINSFMEQTNTKHISKGIGLQNVRKRLDLLYPNMHDLQIKQEDNLFKVFLSIKLS